MSAADARPPLSETLQAWLTLLPAGVLALPVLRGDPTPESSGAGWAALAALPAAALLLVRRVELSARGLVLLLVPLALAAFPSERVRDTFEADRALTLLATALVCLLAAASLGSGGRRVLARGAALLAVAWLAGAALDQALDAERAWSGVLENTGETSEAALLGALAGVALFGSERGLARAVGGTAAVLFALYAGWLPVIAGALAFLASCAALVAFAPRAARRARARGAALAASLLVLSLAGRQILERAPVPSALEPAGDPAVIDPLSSAGGFEVRRRIWSRVPALVRDHALLGVGPGQFESAFPPYRDPAELELSMHGRREPTPVDVEHAHNDWLEGLAEYGVVGGLAWIAFLAWVLWRAFAALRSAEPGRAALGAAAVGVSFNALFNSPLLFNPAASALAFAVFGGLIGRSLPVASRSARSFVVAAVALAFLASRAPRALDFVRHGAALSRLAEARIPRGGFESLAARKAARPIEDALRACPDSVVAIVKRGELARARGESEAAQLELWERALARRPFLFGALLACGNLHARAGRFAQAGGFYAAALEVDAAHPDLGRNLLKLAVDEGSPDGVVRALHNLEAIGVDDPPWIESLAAEALLEGRPHMGLALLERIDPELLPRSGREAWQIAGILASEDRQPLADAMLAHAHLAWAREHVEAGEIADAVRSYRQCLRHSARHLDGGARRVRLELAAALAREGRTEEARMEIETLVPSPLELVELPEWAGEKLLEAGVLGGR